MQAEQKAVTSLASLEVTENLILDFWPLHLLELSCFKDLLHKHHLHIHFVNIGVAAHRIRSHASFLLSFFDEGIVVENGFEAVVSLDHILNLLILRQLPVLLKAFDQMF